MLTPDYHTLQTQAQARIARYQQDATYARDDMRTLRRHSAQLLRSLADALEPHMPHQLPHEVYTHE